MTGLETLGQALRAIEKQGEEYMDASAAARVKAEKAEVALGAHKSLMSFWDKWLFGWFANKEKVARLNELQALHAEFKKISDENDRNAQQTPARMQAAIEAYLQGDENYQKLSRIFNLHAGMKRTVSDFADKVESAKSAVSTAKGVEVIDLFTSNKAVSFLSSMQNSTASARINTVKSALPGFSAAVKKYSNEAQGIDTSNIRLGGVNDTLDLVFDLAFGGGFDFTSIFQLSALNEAGSNLSKLENAVRPIQNAVRQNYSSTDEAIAKYRDAVKKQALAAVP